MKSDLIKLIAVTAELCGTDLSAPAAKAFADNLSDYPETQVMAALKRCQMELKGRLTMVEVVNRIDDGRPGPDEAWGMITFNESDTVVITTEMQKAQSSAWSLWAEDRTGARMAFKEAYQSLVQQARAAKKPVEWVIEQGWDTTGRIGPIREALAKNRIDQETAERYLPPPTTHEIQGAIREKLLTQLKPKSIEGA